MWSGGAWACSGRVRWRGFPMSTQVMTRSPVSEWLQHFPAGNCLRALMSYVLLVRSARWSRPRRWWRWVKTQVPRVIQATRIAVEEGIRARLAREEWDRRQTRAEKRGLGGAAASTRAMEREEKRVRTGEAQEGWEGVVERERDGDAQMQERVRRACVRADQFQVEEARRR